MKTLLLSEIFPPKTGGSGRWFWEIYHRMPNDQFVIAAGDDNDAPSFDNGHDLNLKRIPLSFADWGLTKASSLADYWRAYRILSKLVLEQGVTHIHCGRCLPEGWLAWMLKRRLGIHYTCYVHGEDANAQSSGAADGVLSSRQLRWMTGKVLRDADGVIANSQNSASIACEQWGLPEERVHILHPGVDTNYFVPADRNLDVRQRLGWQDRQVVLTVGRLQKRKGHDMVIRALSTIREAIPNILFAIAGDGEELKPLQDLAYREGQQAHVQFLGKISDADLKAAYQQADLFVLANRQVGTDIEGFGMVLLEAQACGTPVIAGASGGTRETMNIPETGSVIDCTTPNELAVWISKLLLDSNHLSEMGLASRKWAVENFDWESLAQKAASMFGTSIEQASVDPLETVDQAPVAT